MAWKSEEPPPTENILYLFICMSVCLSLGGAFSLSPQIYIVFSQSAASEKREKVNMPPHHHLHPDHLFFIEFVKIIKTKHTHTS
jgi:hypothetical protein